MISTLSAGRCLRVPSVDTIIIGAGHAGLAMSRCLGGQGIEHLLLERGDVANSWRHERWDSLRLLTPNWQNRLPGYSYGGPDPDGFMAMPELIRYLDGYASAIAAPVRTRTRVTAVAARGTGYRVETDAGQWQCRTLVLANGAFAVPAVPALSAAIPRRVTTLTSKQYRNPGQLPEGGVLVVGGSATGLQLADEIQRSGRQVTVAVGDHVRMPRLYRGRDIQWWLDRVGILDQRCDEIEDLARARGLPSAQLIGSPDRTTLDLNMLSAQGIRLAGRLVGISRGRAQFSGALHNHCHAADLKLQRLLDIIDSWIRQQGLEGHFGDPERAVPTVLPVSPCLGLDLAGGEVSTVIWATGYRPDYSWLQLPVLDQKGQLRHRGGVVAAPGVYAMGLPFMRRRKSSFIYGARDDACELAAHLAAYLAGRNSAEVADTGARRRAG